MPDWNKNQGHAVGAWSNYPRKSLDQQIPPGTLALVEFVNESIQYNASQGQALGRNGFSRARQWNELYIFPEDSQQPNTALPGGMYSPPHK
jgi:hypothetical protein